MRCSSGQAQSKARHRGGMPGLCPVAKGRLVPIQRRGDVRSPPSRGGMSYPYPVAGKSGLGPARGNRSRGPGPSPGAQVQVRWPHLPPPGCSAVMCSAVPCCAVHPRGPCPGELQAGAQVQVQVAPGGQVQVQVQGPRSRSSQGSSNQAGPQAQVQIAPGGQGSPLIWVKLIWDYVNLSKLT